MSITTNIIPSQVTQFSAADAISAVEGEATLVLAGDVTIAAGRTLKVDTISEITAGGGVTADGLKVKDGNIVPALGKGIDFTAAAHTSITGAAMASEMFDGYEEGTWTPILLDDTLTGNGSDESQGYTLQSGHYTRIGNWVFLNGWITVISYGTLTSGAAANIGGLPFLSTNVTYHQSAHVIFGDGGGFVLGGAGRSITGCIPYGNKTHIYLKLWDTATAVSTMSIAEFDTPDTIFSASYKID